MAQPQIPKKIGKYTISERIGRGGMGYVYRATDPILKREVALKTMLKDVSEDPELRTRFVREAQSAGGLRHPNIVTIYDLGEDEEGCPYIAMEFLTGTDLEHVIKNRVEMDIVKKLDIVIQTAMGLDFAHKNGIIHRDIKPANIRVLENGETKIMDFGIAKMTASRMTRTGMIMGTPHYMAPEQIRGEAVDNRADIFSLGVVLYELLVCRKPFPGENPTTVLFKIIHSDPDSLADGTFTPPAGLEDCILKALAKDQAQRYQTCEEFARDLINILSRVQPSESTMLSSPRTPLPFSYPGRTPTPAGKRTGVPASTPPPSLPPSTSIPPKVDRDETQLEKFTDVMPSVPPSETAIQPKTMATSAKSYEPVIDSSLTPPTSSPRSLTQAPAESWKKWALLGIVGLIIFSVGLFGAINLIKRLIQPKPADQPSEVVKQSEPVPQKPEVIITPAEKKTPDQQPVVPAVVQGWVAINVLPWAEIQQIKKADGSIITPAVHTTPCLIQLETGNYEITMTNPGYQSLVVQVEVKQNATTIVRKKMRGFNDANAVDSLGL